MGSIGENIRRERKKQHISQIQLARGAGISQSTLSAIEIGAQNPSVATIQEISNALNCPPHLLMREQDVPYCTEDTIWKINSKLTRLSEPDLQRVDDFVSGILAARITDNENDKSPRTFSTAEQSK